MSGYTIPDPASVEENGRTYSGYREGRYHLPNDGAEQDRLDLQHKIWCLLLDNALYLAPFKEEKKKIKRADDESTAADENYVFNVLDIGTGTGIWAAELARKDPEVRVVGTDLSLIQPPPDKVPPTCRFVREDSEEDEWVHEVEFDYIHMRAMLSCFTNHKAMIRKIYDNLRPGGWFESQDFSFEMVAADASAEATLPVSSIARWMQLMSEGINLLGRDLRVAKHYERWKRPRCRPPPSSSYPPIKNRPELELTRNCARLIETGFVDVKQKMILCPTNPWPLDPKDREIGRYFEEDVVASLEGMGMKILQLKGMTPEEIWALVELAKQDVTDRQLHAYTPVYVVYGRKPFDGETRYTGSGPPASSMPPPPSSSLN